MRTLGTIRRVAARLLDAVDPGGSELEADELLAFALVCTRAELLARSSRAILPVEEKRIWALVAERLARVPVAYITGNTRFFGRNFSITRDVLIPRTDTERVVEVCLSTIPQETAARVLELGIGSGCILLTLLCERFRAQGTGTDLSPSALQVAGKNAERLGVQGRLSLHAGNWFEALESNPDHFFDVIVSNPPYIPESEKASLEPEVREHEPAMALFATGDGTEHYRAILAGALKRLVSGGAIVLELGFGQQQTVCAMAREAGYENVETMEDYGGVARVLRARKR